MTGFDVPDCLVFKFEELECTTGKVDTTVYVFYDKKENHYVIRGRRRWSPEQPSCTYSFVSEDVNDLANFLQYIICKDNEVNEMLYNYDNFPLNTNDITFDFLKEYDHDDYEISGYNKKKLNRKRLLNNLRMLRNVFNYYK
jgi:hypothetical protein